MIILLVQALTIEKTLFKVLKAPRLVVLHISLVQAEEFQLIAPSSAKLLDQADMIQQFKTHLNRIEDYFSVKNPLKKKQNPQDRLPIL